MRDPRNPFHLRASEQIASETIFLRLFGTGVLDLLPKDSLFGLPIILRSAPGGGKTSLLRLFTPSSLLTLYANRSHDDYKDLYSRMKELGAMDETGPRTLGVMLSCGKNYSALVDFPWEKVQKDRLFFALLNARVILAALRGALSLYLLEYPSQLQRLSMKVDPDIAPHLGLQTKMRGDQLFDWAKQIEFAIAQALDSLDPLPPKAGGHEDLFALEILKPENIKVDGKDVAEHVLLMFDDVHKLAPPQRTTLGQCLTGSRSQVPVWIAERLEALTEDELLDLGAKRGRDYDDRSLTLEGHWHRYPARYERLSSNIADKRVKEASVEIGSFAECLQRSMDSAELQEIVRPVLEDLTRRVQSRYSKDTRYRDWVATTENAPGSVYERAAGFRTLEILISREERKIQLEFDEIKRPEDLYRKDDSAVRAAAELFLAQEFRLPYYFGFEKLAALSSSNIEQFLTISSDLFEEASSAVIVGKPSQLSPQRQHSIVRGVAKRWWEGEVLRSVRKRTQVRSFVDAIGRFARWETNKPNAPYAPGVTGIAITMSERGILMDQNLLNRRPDLRELASVIAVCLAHNILEADLDRSQGYDRWMLLYLNRLLCAYFELPLQYGGWRPKKVDELAYWVTEGFRPPNAPEETLAL